VAQRVPPGRQDACPHRVTEDGLRAGALGIADEVAIPLREHPRGVEPPGGLAQGSQRPVIERYRSLSATLEVPNCPRKTFLPDDLWNKLEPLRPLWPAHPLGCHNPRVPGRKAMDAILLVLRTGRQWQVLKATGICHPSSAYWRFREWLEARVFHRLWQLGLLTYDKLVGIDWRWLSLDGAQGKAPLEGKKPAPIPSTEPSAVPREVC